MELWRKVGERHGCEDSIAQGHRYWVFGEVAAACDKEQASMGGEEPFVRAILEHLGIFSRRDRHARPE